MMAYSPFLYVFVFAYVRSYHPEIHDILLLENGPIEWLQFIALLVASGLAFMAMVLKKTFVLVGLAVAGFMLLCAFEELDWFQQVYLYPSPEFLEKVNKQQAVNVHNLPGAQKVATLVMVSIALWGLLAPYYRWLRLDAWKLPLIPDKVDRWYLNFILGYYFYFNVYVSLPPGPEIQCMARATDQYYPGLLTWNQQEIVELFLYFVFCCQLYRFLEGAKLRDREDHVQNPLALTERAD